MLTTPRHAPLLASTRGAGHQETVERVHHGSIAVVDVTGRLLASVGDPDSLNFTRSTLKPFQALPFMEDDGPARLGWGSREVAMLCASHNGEAVHVEGVRSMLRDIGAQPADLRCGHHVPHYFDATQRTPPAGARWSCLHHNCSGKHSGFLAWCRLNGRPLRSYLEPEAPLQRRIAAALHGLLPGVPMHSGTDGCSAPNFALPLRATATLYARLAAADSGPLAALRYAMLRHPDLVSGTGRSDLALMQAGAGDWVCKIGADGLQLIGVRSLGLGIAVRLADGHAGMLHSAAVEALVQLGLLAEPLPPALAPRLRPLLRNAAGQVTGRTLACFDLAPLARHGGAGSLR
jgi:L-asparaginase II